MKNSLRNLAISLALHKATMKWVAESVMIALGFIKNVLSVDILRETRFHFAMIWAGWIELGWNILKIEIIPKLAIPKDWRVRPP